jgi:hypothetical protein
MSVVPSIAAVEGAYMNAKNLTMPEKTKKFV